MGSIFTQKELDNLEFVFYCFLGIIGLIGCCIGCCCKIAYDRFIAYQHQEVNQGTLIELPSNQSDIEESVSLLGNAYEH